jgi:transcriptional regulator with XRE-family HTH domain
MNAQSDYSSQLNQLALKVKTLRLKRGLTQQDLADISEIDRKTVNRIENSSYSITLTTLFALAEALDVNPSDLID